MAHGVDVPFDGRYWEVMPRGVQHEAAVRVHGSVSDLNVVSHHQFFGRCIGPVRDDKLS